MLVRRALATWGQVKAAPAAQGDAEDAATSFDLPPLPDPDLRDVGAKPQEIKEFLKGYATAYARAVLAALKQGAKND